MSQIPKGQGGSQGDGSTAPPPPPAPRSTKIKDTDSSKYVRKVIEGEKQTKK